MRYPKFGRIGHLRSRQPQRVPNCLSNSLIDIQVSGRREKATIKYTEREVNIKAIHILKRTAAMMKKQEDKDSEDISPT